MGIRFRVSPLGSVNPSPLGEGKAGWENVGLSKRKPYSMGLQVSCGVDHQVPISGIDRQGGDASQRIASGDFARVEVEHSCWSDQSRSCAHVDLHSAESVGVSCGTILEGKKFSQINVGVCRVEETILGAAFVGSRLLDCIEWKCDRWSVEKVHWATDLGRSGWSFQDCIRAPPETRFFSEAFRGIKVLVVCPLKSGL